MELKDELSEAVNVSAVIIEAQRGESYIKQAYESAIILAPDLLWGGSNGVLNAIANNINLENIPVLQLLSPSTCSAKSNKLRTLVSGILTTPTSHEAIAERCAELAESKIARNLTNPITATSKPS